MSATVTPVATVPTTWTKVRSWLSQSSTITGLMILATDGALVATGAVTWRLELPIAAGGLVGLILPGNTGAATLLAKMLRDLLVAIASKDAVSIMAVAADAQALLVAVGVKVPALPSDQPLKP